MFERIKFNRYTSKILKLVNNNEGDEALEIAEKQLSIIKPNYIDDANMWSQYYANMANINKVLKNFAESERNYLQSFEWIERDKRSSDYYKAENIALGYDELGAMFYQIGNLTKAELYFNKVIEYLPRFAQFINEENPEYIYEATLNFYKNIGNEQKVEELEQYFNVMKDWTKC